jgi:hypothetical protein
MALLMHCARRAGLFAALLLAGSQLCAAALQEYQVKAVFLFNFTQFIEWPPATFADTSEPIVICILGEDPFGAYIDDAIRDEHVDKRALVVRRFNKPEEAQACRILFISRSESAHLDAILQHVKPLRALTVSDARGFGERGGMVGFVTEDNRVRLRINLDAARDAGLTISSKLLRVADIVADHGAVR